MPYYVYRPRTYGPAWRRRRTEQARDCHAEQDQLPYYRTWSNRPWDVVVALAKLWPLYSAAAYYFWQWLETMHPGCVAQGPSVFLPVAWLIVPDVVLGPHNPIATLWRPSFLSDVYPRYLDQCDSFVGSDLGPYLNESEVLNGKQGYIEHKDCPNEKKTRFWCKDAWRWARLFGFPTQGAQCSTVFFPPKTVHRMTASPDDPNGPKKLTAFVQGHGGSFWSPWDRGDAWFGMYFFFVLWCSITLPSYLFSGETMYLLPFTFLLWTCYVLLCCYNAAYCVTSTCYFKAVEFRNKYHTTENFSNSRRSQQLALTYPKT